MSYAKIWTYIKSIVGWYVHTQSDDTVPLSKLERLSLEIYKANRSGGNMIGPGDAVDKAREMLHRCKSV